MDLFSAQQGLEEEAQLFPDELVDCGRTLIGRTTPIIRVGKGRLDSQVDLHPHPLHTFVPFAHEPIKHAHHREPWQLLRFL